MEVDCFLVNPMPSIFYIFSLPLFKIKNFMTGSTNYDRRISHDDERRHKKHAKKRQTGKRGRIKWQGWSGGEENERQVANNVMRGIRVCDGYLVCLDLCVDLPGNGARNRLVATSWALRWFSLEEESVMQQSSVSISLSFWEPRYQSSRRLHASRLVPAQTNKNLATNAIKGLSIPSRPLAKVRSDRDNKINIFGIFII